MRATVIVFACWSWARGGCTLRTGHELTFGNSDIDKHQHVWSTRQAIADNPLTAFVLLLLALDDPEAAWKATGQLRSFRMSNPSVNVAGQRSMSSVNWYRKICNKTVSIPATFAVGTPPRAHDLVMTGQTPATDLDSQDRSSLRLSGILPFTSSIVDNSHLTWMDAVQTQIELLSELGFEKIDIDSKFTLKTGADKPSRIANMAFKSDVFRKVRITYVDAGEKMQVTNTLFYPSFEYDIPMFGIDLISLGRKRVLVGVDFQPLYPTEEYSAKYIDFLAPIRAKYEGLQGSPSDRIYNDTSFFSRNMLFGRYADESMVDSEAIPASIEYLNEYMKLAKKAVPNCSATHMAAVRGRQAAYDLFQAEQDPAKPLFDSYFGKEWSDSFIHDFLFELA